MEQCDIRSQRAVLLGPHPGAGCTSISNYYELCRSGLPAVLKDWSVVSCSPGSNHSPFASAAPTRSSRQRLWFEYYAGFPWHLMSLRADLFHVVDQTLAWYSMFLRGGRLLVTVHDLIAYLAMKGEFQWHSRSLHRVPLLWESARAVVRADHLVCISSHTADLVMTRLGVPAARISVVYNAVDPAFSPLTPQERAAARRELFGEVEYVVIHVGQPVAHKNRIGVLKMFEHVASSLKSAHLFMVHSATNVELDFIRQAALGDRVTFVPPLSRSALRQFYGAADVFVFPSLYEGFGVPPLEAMACGCAVVATAVGSLPEIIGDAGFLVQDPRDYSTLGGKVVEILRSPYIGQELVVKGLERAAAFRPGQCIAGLGEVYSQVLR